MLVREQRSRNAKNAARWRRENPDRAKKFVAISAAKRRLKRRQLIDKIKARPCKDCRQRYPPHVMDLDHVRGVKRAAVGMAQAREWSHAEILKEAAKCEVVCSNCHRKRTHDRRMRKLSGVDHGNFKDNAPD